MSTQTIGTMVDHVLAFAESSSVSVVDMIPIKAQFWDHVTSCMKMPRGGVNGGGSMHCGFEFVAANESVVQFLMEDLPVEQNHRYNNPEQPPLTWKPPWEPSKTISTYHALDLHLLDSFFRLHRRKIPRAYRGSLLAAPPDTHPLPVCLISATTPFLAELCHRKHHKLVLAVSFNLTIHNDLNLQTI